jgi:hypothetical protein
MPRGGSTAAPSTETSKQSARKSEPEPPKTVAAKPTKPKKPVSQVAKVKPERGNTVAAGVTAPRAERRIATSGSRARDSEASNLEVMNLRTIEFPDGRRIQILTRPDRRTLSELPDEPGW